MANIAKIHKTIRKKDGRADCIFGYQCAAPILQDGVYYSKPHEKCEKIAQFFEERLTEKGKDGKVVDMEHGRKQKALEHVERCNETQTSVRQTPSSQKIQKTA